MINVISVRFNNRGKSYYFDPRGLAVNEGDNVIVETAKGLEFGLCTKGNWEVPENSVVKPLRPVVRLATENDKKIAEAGRAKEKEAFDYCVKKIADLGLEMKLVDVEYGFDGNKILFFFTSEGRVDFRELVKDLAGVFRTRIELRQIGVRDEAKLLGGLGVCGKQFCCSQFMREFHPVSIKMAKTQGLSLNPTKISGSCGRLMCCLKYEEPAYEDLVKKAPKIDAFVETPAGKGSVVSVNLLRGSAKVRLEDGPDTTLKTFTFDELSVLGGKGRRAEYIAARNEGRLEEAGFTPSASSGAPKLEPLRALTREKSQPPRKHDQPRQGPRHGQPRPQDQMKSQGQAQGQGQRQNTDRKNAPDQRKKPDAPAPSAQSSEKPTTPPAPRPQQGQEQKPGGGGGKRPHSRRYRGGRRDNSSSS